MIIKPNPSHGLEGYHGPKRGTDQGHGYGAGNDVGHYGYPEGAIQPTYPASEQQCWQPYVGSFVAFKKKVDFAGS